MIVVSKNFLAINILVYVSNREVDIATARDVAEALSLPLPYTRKIVHQLTRSGFLDNRRGHNGGLMLARPAGQILVGEIVLAIEDLRSPSTSDTDLNRVVDDAARKFIEVLNEQSLADFCSAQRTTKPAQNKHPKKSRRAAKPVNARHF